MIYAAGVMYVTGSADVLFLKRGNGSYHPGEWCFPGGHIDDGEDADDAAERESIEELGFLPKGDRKELTRTIKDGVDYTTFIQTVDERFAPITNGEHTGYAWAKIDEPPEPLHPGCRVALRRMNMNELDVAKAIRDEELISPQFVRNMWLFAIRITDTGVAYRSSLNEYVVRKQEDFLSPEFVERCNGLPVIWEHPEKAILDSREYAKRSVGTVFLPYIKDDAVWGIAKIFDEKAARLMRESQISTSPAVIHSSSQQGRLGDGSTLLVEGEPLLLDHIAVVDRGVWDKSGPPTGVLNETLVLERADSMTTDDEKAAAAAAKVIQEANEARARADAEKDAKLDRLFGLLEPMATRLERLETAAKARADAEEEDEKERKERDDSARKDAKARRDAEHDEWSKADAEVCKADDADEEAFSKKCRDDGDDEETAAEKAREDRKSRMDKRRKDAAEVEKEKEERDDAARSDSAKKIDELTAQVAALVALNQPKTADTEEAFSTAQGRADAVYMALGERAPPPHIGEGVGKYDRRIMKALQKHSKRWEKSDLATMPDDVFANARADILAEAMEFAKNPVNLPPGTLREVITTDRVGRQISNFYGPESFIKALNREPMYLTGFLKQGNNGMEAA